MVRQALLGPTRPPQPAPGPPGPLLTRVALQLQPALIHLPAGQPLSAMSRPSRHTVAPAGSPRRPGAPSPTHRQRALSVTRARQRHTSPRRDGHRPASGLVFRGLDSRRPRARARGGARGRGWGGGVGRGWRERKGRGERDVGRSVAKGRGGAGAPPLVPQLRQRSALPRSPRPRSPWVPVRVTRLSLARSPPSPAQSPRGAVARKVATTACDNG